MGWWNAAGAIFLSFLAEKQRGNRQNRAVVAIFSRLRRVLEAYLSELRALQHCIIQKCLAGLVSCHDWGIVQSLKTEGLYHSNVHDIILFMTLYDIM